MAKGIRKAPLSLDFLLVLHMLSQRQNTCKYHGTNMRAGRSLDVRSFQSSSSCRRTRETSLPDSKLVKSSALTDAEPQNSISSRADPWTEVVHKKSGQIYYWNQKTSKLQAHLPSPKCLTPDACFPVSTAIVGQ